MPCHIVWCRCATAWQPGVDHAWRLTPDARLHVFAMSGTIWSMCVVLLLRCTSKMPSMCWMQQMQGHALLYHDCQTACTLLQQCPNLGIGCMPLCITTRTSCAALCTLCCMILHNLLSLSMVQAGCRQRQYMRTCMLAMCVVMPMPDAAADMVHNQPRIAPFMNTGPTAPAGGCLTYMHTSEFEVAALVPSTARALV